MMSMLATTSLCKCTTTRGLPISFWASFNHLLPCKFNHTLVGDGLFCLEPSHISITNREFCEQYANHIINNELELMLHMETNVVGQFLLNHKPD